MLNHYLSNFNDLSTLISSIVDEDYYNLAYLVEPVTCSPEQVNLDRIESKLI